MLVEAATVLAASTPAHNRLNFSINLRRLAMPPPPADALIYVGPQQITRSACGRVLRAPRSLADAPQLLQSLLACQQCGYALSGAWGGEKPYRKLYRCIGSDSWRHLHGPVRQDRRIWQDFLDEDHIRSVPASAARGLGPPTPAQDHTADHVVEDCSDWAGHTVPS